MPKSATGTVEPRAAGFTLVEILVVVLIASVLTGIVLLRLPDPGEAEPGRSVAQLEARLGQACDRALLTGNPRGLRIDRDGYDFWRRVEGRWGPDPELPAQVWPDGLAIEIDPDLPAGGAAAAGPGFICDGLSLSTPLHLEARAGGRRAVLSWTGQ